MALQEKGCFDFNTKALLLKQRAPPPHDLFAGRTKARLARKYEVAEAAVITLVAAIVVERRLKNVVAFRFSLSFILLHGERTNQL